MGFLDNYCRKLDTLVRADFYEYNRCGDVVVYGQNCYGHNITQTYMMYDSLADVKREMKRKGIRNWSKMRKMG